MVSKEMKINSWLDSPVDEYEEDPYYIENKKDNYSVCESFINTIISVIEVEESITNKNQFRDDVIELIYNYSYEHKRK